MSSNKITNAPETTKGLSDEEFAALIKPLWLEAKPSERAQRIRAELSTAVDDGRLADWVLDYIPDYVWDLIDIAAQRGIDYVNSR